jgi:hypothetical protein
LVLRALFGAPKSSALVSFFNAIRPPRSGPKRPHPTINSLPLIGAISWHCSNYSPRARQKAARNPCHPSEATPWIWNRRRGRDCDVPRDQEPGQEREARTESTWPNSYGANRKSLLEVG